MSRLVRSMVLVMSCLAGATAAGAAEATVAETGAHGEPAGPAPQVELSVDQGKPTPDGASCRQIATDFLFAFEAPLAMSSFSCVSSNCPAECPTQEPCIDCCRNGKIVCDLLCPDTLTFCFDLCQEKYVNCVCECLMS
jgi:hypothetical protein